MADLAVTPTKVSPIDPLDCEIVTFIAGVAIAAGKVLYQTAAGKAALADGSAAGTAAARGVALETVGIGQPVSVLKRGRCAGFTIAQAYDAPLYLSDTDAGIVGDVAGTVSTLIGRVVAMPDTPNLTKVIYFDFKWS